MTNRTLLAISLIFLPLTRDELIDNVISYLHDKGPHAEPHVVTPDIRDEVLGRLKSELPENLRPDLDSLRTYRILLRLGDEETTRQIVNANRFRWLTDPTEAILMNSEGQLFLGVLAYSAQPAVIPLIAEDFFRNDGDKITSQSVDDLFYTKRPFSIEMCRVAFAVMSRSEAFPKSTRDWAKECSSASEYDSPPPLVREMMQKWWRENEARFRAADYQAVHAGQSLPAPERPPVIELPPSDSPSIPMTVPSPVKQNTPSDVTVVSDVSAPSSAFFWTGAGISIALLVGLAVFWKRRV